MSYYYYYHGCVCLQCMSPVLLESAVGLNNMTRGGIVFTRLSLTHVNIVITQ